MHGSGCERSTRPAAELLPTGVTLCFLDISHQGEVHLKLRDTGNATRMCFKVAIPQLQSSNDMFDTMAFFGFLL